MVDQQPGAPRLQEDRSLGELFGDLTRDLSQLMRDEVKLAKTELQDEARKAGKAGGMFGAGAAIGYAALLLLSFAAAWGLAEVMPTGFAFLIVGAVHALIAALLFLKGRSQAKEVRPVPDQTIETLKEDAEWAKAQLK
jgi:hypothetical protein